MIYRFGSFELDMAKVELRSGGAVCPVEPQVFALLALLVDQRERLVSRDEIIEKVWEGRVFSDAAVASRSASSPARSSEWCMNAVWCRHPAADPRGAGDPDPATQCWRPAP